MKMLLKSMTLLNFKGVRNLTINFSKVTNISGENRTGKTTIVDAFFFLLWGKNSYDVKDFNIKTLDKENNPIPKLNHEVSAVIEIDDYDQTFRRVYKEKWTKKKGSEITEMTGHVTELYINDVPFQLKEYQSKIDGIINEELLKLLTNPLYFNSNTNSWKWQNRREVLSKIAGNVTDAEVAGDNEDFLALLALLNNKSIEEFKREIASRKKRLKDDLARVPIRIDEATRSMPIVENWSVLETKIGIQNTRIAEIEKQMEDKTLAHQTELNKIRDKQNDLHQLKLNLSSAEQSAKSDKQTRRGRFKLLSTIRRA
jgi:exonuclease SbcC